MPESLPTLPCELEFGTIVEADDGDYIYLENGLIKFSDMVPDPYEDDEPEVIVGFDFPLIDLEDKTEELKPPPKKRVCKKKTDTTDEEPKKRGRPPKPKDIIEACVPPKPRGRPKKEKPEKTRAPTAYNLFVKEHLPIINKEHPDLDKKAKMTMVSDLWKLAKANAVD